MTANITCAGCTHTYADSALFCPNCGRPKVRDLVSDVLLGKVLGERFQVQEQIGQGGSGTIYRAEHITLRRKVAIKVLHNELSRDDLAVERFRREATTVAEIDNEHIVEIHDFGRTPDGRLYLAMELLDGETLDSVLARERTLSVERAADILIQVGEALMEAHAIGYVHRDLRPRNVYLAIRRGKANFVKLLDFGLAKLVETDSQAASTSLGMTFGDPRYMSPEAARGDRIDRRADIYQLGCVAYEMLTGAPPFSGNRVFDILTKQVTEIPAPLPTRRPGVPLWMEAAVTKMLAKDPENRFATTTRMVEALRRGLDTGEVMDDEIARRRESIPPPSVSRVMQRMGLEPGQAGQPGAPPHGGQPGAPAPGGAAGQAEPAGHGGHAGPAGHGDHAGAAGQAAPVGHGGHAGAAGQAAPAGHGGHAGAAGQAAPAGHGGHAGQAAPAGHGGHAGVAGQAAPAGHGGHAGVAGQAAPAGHGGHAGQAAPAGHGGHAGVPGQYAGVPASAGQHAGAAQQASPASHGGHAGLPASAGQHASAPQQAGHGGHAGVPGQHAGAPASPGQHGQRSASPAFDGSRTARGHSPTEPQEQIAPAPAAAPAHPTSPPTATPSSSRAPAGAVPAPSANATARGVPPSALVDRPRTLESLDPARTSQGVGLPASKADSVELLRRRTGTPRMGVPIVPAPVAAPVQPSVPIEDPSQAPVAGVIEPAARAAVAPDPAFVRAPTAPEPAVPAAAPVPAPSSKKPAADADGISQVWYEDGDRASDEADGSRVDRARKTITPSVTDMSFYDELPRRRRWGLIVASLGVLVAGGVALALGLRGGSSSSTPAPPPPEPVAAPPTAVVDAAPSTIIGGDSPDTTQVAIAPTPPATTPTPAPAPKVKVPPSDTPRVTGSRKPPDLGTYKPTEPTFRAPGGDPPKLPDPVPVKVPVKEPSATGAGSASPTTGVSGREGPEDPYSAGDPPSPETAPPEKRAEFFANLGAQQLANSDAANAAANFKKALELDPKSVTATAGMGEIALRQGLFGDAIAHLKKASRLAPRNARIFTLLGEAYLSLGQNTEAAANFKKALQIDPDNQRARDGYNEASSRVPPPTDE